MKKFILLIIFSIVFDTYCNCNNCPIKINQNCTDNNLYTLSPYWNSYFKWNYLFHYNYYIGYDYYSCKITYYKDSKFGLSSR